jgi:hypothetical protein
MSVLYKDLKADAHCSKCDYTLKAGWKVYVDTGEDETKSTIYCRFCAVENLDDPIMLQRETIRAIRVFRRALPLESSTEQDVPF